MCEEQLIVQVRTETKSVQEERKKDKKQPLLFHYKDHKDQFYKYYNTYNPQATTAPNSKQPTEPYSSCSTNPEPNALKQLH